MKILLFSMPDGTHPLYPRFCRPPNLGLASLAGNLRGEADVFVADLILRRENVPAAIQEALDQVQPDMVGLSCMTFQYFTARKVAGVVRRWNPEAPIVLGGYHATIMHEEIAVEDRRLFDFICRGESEKTFLELVLALKAGKRRFEGIAGLSWRDGAEFRHNGARALAPLCEIAPPDRRSRLWSGYRIHGMGFDTAETSRGCTLHCNFCSITQMYGRSFRTYPLERVLSDLDAAARLGAKEIFLADDNITLATGHLEGLCRGLAERGLPKRLYLSTQASVPGLGRDLGIIGRMAEAGFNLVFLGIENISRRNLLAYKKGDSSRLNREVIAELRRNRIMVMGGFILGSPDDDEEDLLAQFRFMEEQALDAYLVQILTPYPKVPITAELERLGLVANRDLRRYSGFFANVRTKHLSSKDLDFIRWKHFPYYRSPRWFLNAVAPRRFPLALVSETLARVGEGLLEKARKRLFCEEYAFMKYIERHLCANLFFGETPEIRWPDLDRAAKAAGPTPEAALSASGVCREP
ncbi:MAG: B12-binding domain-containing radical SAM protein [Elusimicrobia bacterium]|nr:B12-binding domain-containing radical SAM protein [Elusimicrobiota bacterium]